MPADRAPSYSSSCAGVSLTRIVASLAVLVGLLTGLGTIIGWVVSSEPFVDALSTAATLAGLVYILLVLVSGLFVAMAGLPEFFQRLLPRRLPKRTERVLLILSCLIVYAVATFVVILPWNETVLRVTGALCLALVLAGLAVIAYAQHRESQKVCPDCVETVKAEARVCRYCGHRFAPLADAPSARRSSP